MRKHEISTEQAQQEFVERDRLEALLDEMPEPTTVAEDIQQMQSVGLYCGACGHGNGCEHGVPASRY